MPSLLITGTGTGVGKTIITAALARAWRFLGIDAGVMKPLACGFDPGHTPHDTALLRASARVDDPLELVTPLAFEAPLAPSEAARLAGCEVDLVPVDAALDALQRRHTHLLVEGIGGALVPLTDEVAVADWAVRHRLPAAVVARTDLGTLSHTRMTLEVLAARGLCVLGVILNRVHGGPPGLDEQTNPAALRRLLTVPVWGPVDFVEGLGDAPPEEAVALLPRLAFADEVLAALS